MEKEKRIDLSEFAGEYSIEEAKTLIENIKQKIYEAEGIPECGNNNPPCSPNIKFGGLECCNCNWSE